jgi:hypothetical protein
MVAAKEVDVWPNDAGFDTTYEENEPVELAVKGTIPPYVAGVLCKCLNAAMNVAQIIIQIQFVLALLDTKQRQTTAAPGLRNIGLMDSPPFTDFKSISPTTTALHEFSTAPDDVSMSILR